MMRVFANCTFSRWDFEGGEFGKIAATEPNVDNPGDVVGTAFGIDRHFCRGHQGSMGVDGTAEETSQNPFRAFQAFAPFD